MVEVYIDGASAGNPGPSGAGVYIHYNGEQIRKAYPLGVMTNHEAEFHALIQALHLCHELQFKTIFVRTDSQIVEKALNNKYVKREEYRQLLQQALELIEENFDFVFVKWVPSKQNKEADLLAKRAIQMSVNKQ